MGDKPSPLLPKELVRMSVTTGRGPIPVKGYYPYLRVYASVSVHVSIAKGTGLSSVCSSLGWEFLEQERIASFIPNST